MLGLEKLKVIPRPKLATLILTKLRHLHQLSTIIPAVIEVLVSVGRASWTTLLATPGIPGVFVGTAFTKSFYSSAKVILEYDNTPGEGIGSTETKYILGLGWTY